LHPSWSAPPMRDRSAAGKVSGFCAAKARYSSSHCPVRWRCTAVFGVGAAASRMSMGALIRESWQAWDLSSRSSRAPARQARCRRSSGASTSSRFAAAR
jgi:hypothetical protein